MLSANNLKPNNSTTTADSKEEAPTKTHTTRTLKELLAEVQRLNSLPAKQKQQTSLARQAFRRWHLNTRKNHKMIYDIWETIHRIAMFIELTRDENIQPDDFKKNVRAQLDDPNKANKLGVITCHILMQPYALSTMKRPTKFSDRLGKKSEEESVKEDDKHPTPEKKSETDLIEKQTHAATIRYAKFIIQSNDIHDCKDRYAALLKQLLQDPNYSKEEIKYLAKYHIRHVGIEALKLYPFSEEEQTELKQYAKQALRDYLPQISVEQIKTCLASKDSMEFAYLVYQRLSGNYFIPSYDSKTEQHKITDEDELQHFLQLMEQQENYFLNHGWEHLIPSTIDRPDPWGTNFTRRKIDPDKPIRISHGGGLFHILEFLTGKAKGYSLEEGCQFDKTDNTKKIKWFMQGDGQGLQVSPDVPSSGSDRDAFYANNARSLRFFDYPAQLMATVKPKYLDNAVNGYEAGLRSEMIDLLTDVRVKRFL